MPKIKINPEGVLGSVRRRKEQQNKNAEALGLPRPYKRSLGKKIRNYAGEKAKKNAPKPYKKLMRVFDKDY